MTINIETKDIFTVPQGYYLAHCISGDYALGAGVAKQFDAVYNMKAKLNDQYRVYEEPSIGSALLVDNVFNLVTKEKCYQKPTYSTLEETLVDMREQMNELMITKLAMPKIGCGLDRLDWDRVLELITEVFNETDAEILICTLD